jgi:hypothetical protein
MSVCSSSTRNSHDDSDEVDGRQSSSDESDSDESNYDEKERKNETPITYEYILGTASPAYHHKLPKLSDLQNASNASATITSQSVNNNNAVSNKKSAKASSNAGKSAQLQINKNKHNHHQQGHNKQQAIETDHIATNESSDDEKLIAVGGSAKQSLFLNLLKAIREFFDNRNNWSVTEESIIIWLGFMLFAIVVGCILHILMA